MKVHILHTGGVKVYKGTPIRDSNPFHKFGLNQTEKDQMVLPVSAYLIEHPKGTILIDTGWAKKLAHSKPAWPLEKISAPVVSENQSVVAQLDKMNLKPQDLDGVWLSHLDFDHTSGLEDLKEAKSFHVSRPELEDTKTHLLRYQKDTFSFVDLHTFDYEKTGIGPEGESYDVFGDGSVVLIHTPGHTDGMFSVRLKDHQGNFILLASDAIYLPDSLEKDYLPGYCMSVLQAEQTTDWLREQKKLPGCLLIAGNHDPKIKAQTIILDEKEDNPPQFLPLQVQKTS